MTATEAQAAVTKHGSQRAASRALGCSHKTLWKALHRDAAKLPDAGSKGRSLAEFRSAYDKGYIVPRKITAALKALRNGWEYEVQFARLAGVSLADLAAFRDQFAEHVVSLHRDGRRAWAGTAAVAREMKEMLS